MHNSFQIYMLKVHTERGNSPSNEQLMESMPSVSCTLKKQYTFYTLNFPYIKIWSLANFVGLLEKFTLNLKINF